MCFDGLLSSDKISFVPLSGPDASDDKIAAAVAKSDGMIVAIDERWTLTKPQLDEIARLRRARPTGRATLCS